MPAGYKAALFAEYVKGRCGRPLATRHRLCEAPAPATQPRRWDPVPPHCARSRLHPSPPSATAHSPIRQPSEDLSSDAGQLGNQQHLACNEREPSGAEQGWERCEPGSTSTAFISVTTEIRVGEGRTRGSCSRTATCCETSHFPSLPCPSPSLALAPPPSFLPLGTELRSTTSLTCQNGGASCVRTGAHTWPHSLGRGERCLPPGPHGRVANPGVSGGQRVTTRVAFSRGDRAERGAWSLSLPEGAPETRAARGGARRVSTWWARKGSRRGGVREGGRRSAAGRGIRRGRHSAAAAWRWRGMGRSGPGRLGASGSRGGTGLLDWSPASGGGSRTPACRRSRPRHWLLTPSARDWTFHSFSCRVGAHGCSRAFPASSRGRALPSSDLKARSRAERRTGLFSSRLRMSGPVAWSCSAHAARDPGKISFGGPQGAPWGRQYRNCKKVPACFLLN